MTLCVVGIEKETCQKMEKDGSAMTVSSTLVGGRGGMGLRVGFFFFFSVFKAHINSLNKF